MKRLENKHAIITGAAGGIGKTTAKLFLEEGAKVFLVDVNEAALKSTAEELGGKQVAWCVADVSKSADVQKYVNEAVKAFGKIDVFFNNAGIEGAVKSIEEYPEEVFDRLIGINVKGVWLGMKYVLPQMKDGGSIINTSSTAGIEGTPYISPYITSKHAVRGMTKSIAKEAAPRKIRVNSVHPSPVETRMMRSLEEGFDPKDAAGAKKNFAVAIPLGRYAEPLEIAQGVLFLASDESKFITGSALVIDCGLTA